MIYEVNNTFGQTHAYVLPATGAAVELHQAKKAMYVSPFYRVEGRYRFRLIAPAERFELTIQKQVQGKADFLATQVAQRVDLSDLALLRLFVQLPMMTLGVVLAIHWQALKLWLKGAPFSPRPSGPQAGASRGQATAPPG